MKRLVSISIKIPKEIYEEFILRVPEGERSKFIREAIMEKLQKTPRPDRILELEKRIKKLEEEFSKVKKYLACLLYTSPSPRDRTRSRMPSSA